MRHKLSFSFRRFSKESWSWREIWVSPWNCAKFNLKLRSRSCRRMPHSHLTMKWVQIWQMNVLMIASAKHDCSSTCRRKFENDLKKNKEFHRGRQLEWPLGYVIFLKVVSYLKKTFFGCFNSSTFSTSCKLFGKWLKLMACARCRFHALFNWSRVAPVTGEDCKVITVPSATPF